MARGKLGSMSELSSRCLGLLSRGVEFSRRLLDLTIAELLALSSQGNVRVILIVQSMLLTNGPGGFGSSSSLIRSCLRFVMDTLEHAQSIAGWVQGWHKYDQVEARMTKQRFFVKESMIFYTCHMI